MAECGEMSFCQLFARHFARVLSPCFIYYYSLFYILESKCQNKKRVYAHAHAHARAHAHAQGFANLDFVILPETHGRGRISFVDQRFTAWQNSSGRIFYFARRGHFARGNFLLADQGRIGEECCKHATVLYKYNSRMLFGYNMMG